MRRLWASLVFLTLCAGALSCAGGSRVDDGTLIKNLDNPRWQIRASAAEELGRRNVGGAATRLSKALEDDAEEVRAAAALSLGRLGARSELGPIRHMIATESDPQALVMALFAMVDLSEGESAARRAMDGDLVAINTIHDHRRVRSACRRVLGKIIGPEAAAARVKGVDARDKEIRVATAEPAWHYDRIEDRLQLDRDGTCTLERALTVRGDRATAFHRLEVLLSDDFPDVERVAGADGRPITFLSWNDKGRQLAFEVGSIGFGETATFTVTARSRRPVFLSGSNEAMLVYHPGPVNAAVSALHVELSPPAGGAHVTLDRTGLTREAARDLVLRTDLARGSVTWPRTPPRYRTRGFELALAGLVAAVVLALLAAAIVVLRRKLGDAAHRAILVAVLAAGGFLLISPTLIEDNLPYYALARSAVMDGDLDRANEDAEFNQTQAYAPDHRDALDPVFGSLFRVPFIAAGHALNSAINAVSPSYAPNGFSFPYIYLAALGDFLAVLVGCLACFSLVERRVGPGYGLFAVLSVLLGTNLLLFTYGWTGSSFQPSFLVFAVFLNHWDKTRENRSRAAWFGGGVLLGILVMTRTLNAAFVLIPILDWIHTAGRRLQREGAPGLAEPLRNGAILTSGMLLGYAPQLVLQRLVDHVWFVDAYGVGTGRFSGLTHHLFGLFISRNEMLTWNGVLLAMPVVGLAFVGLIPLLRLDRTLGVWAAATIALLILVIGSYEFYWGFFRYATPYFLPASPILCLAMGSLMREAKTRWGARGPAYLWLLAAPLVARNMYCVTRQVAGDTMGAWDANLDFTTIVHSTLMLGRKVEFDGLRGSADVAFLLRETVGALENWDFASLLSIAFWAALLLAFACSAYFVWSRKSWWTSLMAQPAVRRSTFIGLGLAWVALMGWLVTLGTATNVDYRVFSTQAPGWQRLLKIERIEPGGTLTVPLPLRNPAGGVSLITFLDGAENVPQGSPVAKVDFDPSWSRSHFELRAGVDTADFAIDRPESKTERAHAAPLDKACYSWRVRDDSSHFYTGRAYVSEFAVQNPGQSGSLTVTSTLNRGTLAVVVVNVQESKLPRDPARRRWLADRW